MDLRNGLIFFLLTPFLLLTAHGVNAEPDIPSVRELPVSITSFDTLLGSRQLVLLHDSTPIETSGSTDSVRFVSSATVVDTRPEVVRRTVLNFRKYPRYLSAYQRARVVRVDKSGTTVDFEFNLNMALIEPTVNYRLKYSDGPNDDLIFTRESGTFVTRRGRWEFVPLSKNRTLLAFTGWIDYGGLTWTADAILWAQPELMRALPVTRATTLVDTIRQESENTPTDTRPLRADPAIPTVFKDKSRIQPLATLTESGIPMFVHPTQYISDNGDSINLIFTSTIDLVKGPIEPAKNYLTRFEKVPNFIRQLKSVESVRTDTGLVATWDFNLGFSILSIPVSYRVAYKWTHTDRLVYRRIEGDFEKIYGAYEWHSLSENRTLYAFSSASHVGEDAPSTVQLANLIPNRQIFMGVTLGAIGVENAVAWTNRQLQAETITTPRDMQEN